MRVRRTNEQSKAELRRRVIQETSLSFALLGQAVVASKKYVHIPLIGFCLGSSLWILSQMLFCISCALLHHHVLCSLALFLPTTVNHCFPDFMSASHPGALQAARVFLLCGIAHFGWGDLWGGFLRHVPPPASKFCINSLAHAGRTNIFNRAYVIHLEHHCAHHPRGLLGKMAGSTV